MTSWSRHPRENLGLLIGLVLLAGLTTISVVGELQLTTAMVAAPIVASFLADVRRTAVVAVGAVLASAFGGLWLDLPMTGSYWFRVGLCIGLSVLATVSALLRDRREARLRRMIVIAETAQRAVLRSMPTAIGSVGLAARYVSASEEALVGGDLYEVAATPYGVRVIVGDVRGKGLEAVQTAAAVLGAFRAAAFTEPDPASLARRIDEALLQHIGDEEFVTAILGQFHGEHVVLANCGHHPPLLVTHAGAALVDTGEPTLPLGLGSAPVLSEHTWPAGSRLLFYTDGLVEARDRQGEFFPLDDFATELGEGPVDEALDRLVERLLTFGSHDTSDDVALVLAQNG
ncbi:PP2C family protein-serine/threonine phosphatase [Nocardioides lianchengensis]|uniref:Stage II sporulation protein E (SpoIIE) n=1 Tax=Nocardioides lianchengensis TaxID=1045774 RepID=A0A1G7B9Z1_9ACTN|nr:PP2C family protein-serine/threonine phosphatase [Nocardioides lianchengensis]NYG10081.1 serine phosphatase RsbU (regulator of sigma subunit) [Nocardioides lianchengensis]SDE23065.1 Stage II sporulation protein E (SpoIIE) [Nocardioides lianchengensis]